MRLATRAFAAVCLATAILILSCGGGGGGSRVQAPAAAPGSVTVQAGTKAATVQWGAVAGATSYNVYCAADSAVRPDNFASLTDGRKLATGATSLQVTGLRPAYGYYFAITAVNGAGEGPGSTAVVAVPSGAIAAPVVTAQPGDGLVELGWDPIAGASSYTVVHASASGLNFTDLRRLAEGNMLSASEPRAVVTGLANGRQYWFAVSAYASAEESGLSSEVSATPVHGAPACETGTPQPRVTTALLKGSIQNPPGTVTSVWFEYGSTEAYGSATAPVQFAIAGNIDVEASIEGLAQTTTYHARIAAQNGSGTFYGGERTMRTLLAPTPVASGLSFPAGLAVDADHLYVAAIQIGVSSIDARVLRLPLAGGTSLELDKSGALAGAGAGTAGHLALSGNTLVWAQCESGTVDLIQVDGSGHSPLASGRPCPRFLATAAGFCYWTEEGRIAGAPLSGGPAFTVSATSMAPAGIASDGAFVYWLEGSSLKRAPAAGGSPVILALDLQSPFPLRLSGSSLYWLEGRSLRSIPATGGVAITVASGLAAADTFEAEAGAAYVLGTVPGGNLDRWLLRVPLTGGATLPLTFQEGVAGDIALGPATVFWGDAFGPGVYALPKSY